MAETLGEKNPYRYRGYRYDSETGLYYLQSRYYNPEWGRFVNADDLIILQLTQGELLSHNLYSYCGNDPVNKIDPNGFIAMQIISAVAGGIISELVECTFQAIAFFITHNYSIKNFKVNLRTVGREFAFGLVSGAFMATKYGKGVQGLFNGGLNTIKGVLQKLSRGYKINLSDVLLDFGVGFISGYIGGNGLGYEFKTNYWFKKGIYYYVNGRLYRSLPITKTVIKSFIKSVTGYIAGSVFSRVRG